MSASDYSGEHGAHSSSVDKPQYSQVARSSVFPKKEQAIVLNVNEELRLSDYVVEIGKIVEPKNIKFASRISNSRICIYLSSVQLVDNIVKEYSSIKIREHTVGLRRLITPAKRLILSSVCPSIPHENLQHEIRKLGFTQVSQMSFLRAGLSGEEYSHILSFRRQIYVAPDDNIQLPSSILVNYEDVSYRVYLTFDELTCFSCKAPGHVANNCPKRQIENTHQDNGDSTIQQPTNQEPSNQEPITQDVAIHEPTSQQLQVATSDTQTNSQLSQKRPISPPTTSESQEASIVTIVQQNKTDICFVKPDPPHNKKLKKSNSSEEKSTIAEQLKPIEDYINKASPPFILTMDQVTDLFENSKGETDLLSLAREYTSDIPKLLDMLYKIHPHLTHRSIKSRNTRLQNKIKKQLSKDTESFIQFDDYDTDCSVSSQCSSI